MVHIKKIFLKILKKYPNPKIKKQTKKNQESLERNTDA